MPRSWRRIAFLTASAIVLVWSEPVNAQVACPLTLTDVCVGNTCSQTNSVSVPFQGAFGSSTGGDSLNFPELSFAAQISGPIICPILTPSTNVNWIHLLGVGVTGPGDYNLQSGTLVSEPEFSVDYNPFQSPRVGTITFNNIVINVTQGANTCSYALDLVTGSSVPSNLTFPQSPFPGSGQMVFFPAPDCQWTAASSVTWFTISPTSGVAQPIGGGEGQVVLSYRIAQNIGAARMGTLTIGAQTFTISQNGAALTITSTQIDPVTFNKTPNYTFTFQATGGMMPDTWAASPVTLPVTYSPPLYPPLNVFCAGPNGTIVQNCLPPGLVFNPSNTSTILGGTISLEDNTDLVSGTYNLAVTVTDSTTPTPEMAGPTVLPLTVYCAPGGDSRDTSYTPLYRTYTVLNVGKQSLLGYVAPGLRFVPSCSSFTSAPYSAIFPGIPLTLQSGSCQETAFKLTRGPLQSGLDGLLSAFVVTSITWEEITGIPFNPRRITCVYRVPAASNGERHQFGDAVDLGNDNFQHLCNSTPPLPIPPNPVPPGYLIPSVTPPTPQQAAYAEWEAMYAAAIGLHLTETPSLVGAGFVEPWNQVDNCLIQNRNGTTTPGDVGHLHADWRNIQGDYIYP